MAGDRVYGARWRSDRGVISPTNKPSPRHEIGVDYIDALKAAARRPFDGQIRAG